MEMLIYIVSGGVAGFLYWRYYGCNNGFCIMGQNKYMSITVGALMGFLVVSSSGCAQPDQQASTQDHVAIQNAVVLEDIPAAAFAEKMQQDDVILIDVRTPEEFASGYLKGAVNINYNAPDFADQIAKLDPTKTYLVYCRSGMRSGNAGKILSDKGFHTVYTLKGGLNAWTGEVVK